MTPCHATIRGTAALPAHPPKPRVIDDLTAMARFCRPYGRGNFACRMTWEQHLSADVLTRVRDPWAIISSTEDPGLLSLSRERRSNRIIGV